jgi:hypothetical protein
VIERAGEKRKEKEGTKIFELCRRSIFEISAEISGSMFKTGAVVASTFCGGKTSFKSVSVNAVLHNGHVPRLKRRVNVRVE